ncbi:hypothetical protein K501DRAFT_338838 [Backusella circina FSU 941]|nr:hypothetical protein K501DRAFT_338838 [Backusella circina FSU 941]
MRAAALSLTLCATFILLANAEQGRNFDTQEIKAPVQKRAIVVYEVEPVGTNRNTDDNLNLPPLDPAALNGNLAPSVGSSQSGGFGDRKKKDHKEIKSQLVATSQQGQAPKKEKDVKKEEKKEEENNEEGATEKPKENKDSEEEEVKEDENNEEEEEEEEVKEDENNEEEEDEEEEEEEDDDKEEEEGVKGQAAQGMVSANANYSQRDNIWFAEENNTASEKELTFRPASLAPEKTSSGDKPQSSTFKSRQGVEKIIDTPDVSGASKRNAVAFTLSAAAIIGSFFFSL